MTIEWHEFDYSNKEETKPPDDQLVWVIEDNYLEGIGIGTFDGFTFRMWYGSDDCSVSYWAEIEYPKPPSDWKPWSERKHQEQ